MSKDEYLITDAPLKALTVFAMPMILGSFFQQVYNMADSIIVGQYVGSSALAAVGACAALTNVFICVALGAGIGAGVLVSRYFGARDYSKMKTIVSTSLISFMVLSILLGVCGLIFSRSMMTLLQTPADILDEAVLYLRVYFAGFPFLFMYNILSTMFNSIGESKIPLGLLIFSSVLNIVMDLWMVAGLGLGVFGAALATLIAQGISAVFSLLIFLWRMRQYKGRFDWFDRHELHSMLRIAVPSVLQQSTVSIGMMIVQAVVNPFGTQALAGYSATMRVENVFSLIFVSIGNAVSPYVSQNLGAKKLERIKKGYHAALVLDLCFAILAFIVIATLSAAFSDFKYEAFWGNEGRFSGAFLLILYAASYFCVSRLLKFKSWFIDIALLSCMAVCIFGFTDYLGMDLLHFKVRLKTEHMDMFTSFIGNINMYTGLLSVYLGAACLLWVSCPNKLRSIWYYVNVWVIFIALITGRSDNAYLSLAAAFTFIPIYAFRTRQGIRRYVVLLATFLTSLKVIEWIATTYADRVYRIDSLYNSLVSFSKLILLIKVLWIIAIILYLIDFISKKADATVSPWFSRIWIGLIVIGFAAFLYVLYDVNIVGNADKYGSAKSFLLFNDSWGTHRGVIWRLAIEDYQDFTPIHKLFGYGPDTFGLVTYYHNMDIMTNVYHQIFDSAHNEYLQFFITVGPIGLLSYLAIFVTAFIQIIKKGCQNPYVIAAMFGVLCYSAQATVNIGTPITIPIMFLFLSMALAGCREA